MKKLIDLFSVVNFDANNIVISDYGFKNRQAIVDYAVLKVKNTDLAFWYDIDDCIELQDYDSTVKYLLRYNLVDKNISIGKIGFNAAGTVIKKEIFEFPDIEGLYSEEEFFMMSTLHNVGECTYEVYKAFKGSVLNILQIIKDKEFEEDNYAE